mgnify:CR=1 FL=1
MDSGKFGFIYEAVDVRDGTALVVKFQSHDKMHQKEVRNMKIINSISEKENMKNMEVTKVYYQGTIIFTDEIPAQLVKKGFTERTYHYFAIKKFGGNLYD